MTGNAKFPLTLRVASWIFLLDGLIGVVAMAIHFAHRNFIIDFGALGIPIYFGLRASSSFWRSFAVMLVTIGLIGTFVGVLGVLLMPQFVHGKYHLTMMGTEVPAFPPWVIVACVAYTIGYLAVSFWILHVLRKPDIVILFRSTPDREIPSGHPVPRA
jgi:hypothetical protein